MTATRELYLPAHGSPHWLPGVEPPGGLLYLAWGRRSYGRHPIPLRLHHGWTYMVVLSGHPVFLAGDRRHATSAGSLIVAGPDVPYGWTDRATGSCTLLVWVWSAPPALGAGISDRTCWIRRTDTEGMAELDALHRRARREVQRPDPHSPSALAAIKHLVDTALARNNHAPATTEARDIHRLQLAEQWMRRHLDIRSPVAALADYLGVSPMGLQRLFRQATGTSPGRAFLEVKMQTARAMLTDSHLPVKAVALALGYRHTGDFTRAFAGFFGHPPSKGRQAGSRRHRGAA